MQGGNRNGGEEGQPRAHGSITNPPAALLRRVTYLFMGEAAVQYCDSHADSPGGISSMVVMWRAVSSPIVWQSR